LPFAPEDLLELVADVATYPTYIKWIKAARVSAVRSTPTGTEFVGEAVIGFKAFRSQFSTHVEVDRKALSVTTRLIKGPFKSLHCSWGFRPSESGCLVDLSLNFEFSEPFLAELLAANMDNAVTKLIKAFTIEAEKRYQTV
jgi:coenzyme Q-binding protein COQ10